MSVKDSEIQQDVAAGDHGYVLDGDDPALENLLSNGTKKKKPKKRARPQGQRGLGKPTGMEEFFADSPMTPAQYDEIKEIYSPNVSFLDRILTAIQRFERTRKLTPDRRDIFYKWLHFGSIVIGQSQFTGLGAQETEDFDTDQLADLKSKVQVSDDLRKELETTHTEKPKYVVDFLGCAKAYLSYHAANNFGFESRERVVTATTTIERFMDYLLQQEVCPEYKDDVLRTRDFCRDAPEELWNVQQAQRIMPGEFNRACSTLFGGHYGKHFTSEKPGWSQDAQEGSVYVGMTDEEASQIFGLAMSTVASDDVYERYLEYIVDGRKNLEVVKTITEEGFEILQLEPPTEDNKILYYTRAKDYRPLGRVLAKPWDDPYAAPEDLREEEKQQLRELRDAQRAVYTFYIEADLMQYFKIGQKILATIKQLNCGAWFFDEFTTLYPSFENYIMNDLLLFFKAPRALPGAVEWEPDNGKTEDSDTEGLKATACVV